MEFLKTNKILTLYFLLAFLCLGTISVLKSASNDFVVSKIQNDNNKLGKSFKIPPIKLKVSAEDSKFIELEEDDDCDSDDDSFSSYENKVAYRYSSVLNNSISTKIEFTKNHLFILFCSLKLPFVI